MKQATFLEGVGVALIASIAGAAGFSVLAGVYYSGSVLMFIITVLCFAYVMYLLARSRERVGRITVIVVWTAVMVMSWLLAPSTLIYLVIQLGMIWLIRSLYYYSSVLASLADLGLSSLSLVVALWAWSSTHSLLMSFWCFFLVQALFVFIPRKLAKSGDKVTDSRLTEDPFDRAHRVAEVAVRKLTVTH